MAKTPDKPSGASKEEVAYWLLMDIQKTEQKGFFPYGDNPASKEWILSTYAECIQVVLAGGANHSKNYRPPLG